MAHLRRLAFLLSCLALAACGLSLTSVGGVAVTPAPTVVAPHRQFTYVQYCPDDTGSYPRGLWSNANRLVANSLTASVVPNSDGVLLYATAIASNTFDPANSLAPFTVQPIRNYPALPTPLPTPPQDNPVSYSATATTVANQQSAGIAAYNTQVANINATVQSVRAQVTTDAKRLTSWNPPVDATATSVWGCLQLARDRFANELGSKYLIIASDMQNNTNVDFTADFQRTQALKGVSVHVIFYYCQSAGACQDLANSWRQVFISSGARSVTFDDPAQSLAIGNLFGGA